APPFVQIAAAGPSSPIGDDPLLVSAECVHRRSPRSTAIEGSEQVAEEERLLPASRLRGPRDAVVVELSLRIRGENGIATGRAGIDRAGAPGEPSIRRVSEARFAKVGLDALELPPADRHAPRIVRVDGDRGLVRGVVEDIGPGDVDVDLNAGE